jgi:hypothetical protein
MGACDAGNKHDDGLKISDGSFDKSVSCSIRSCLQYEHTFFCYYHIKMFLFAISSTQNRADSSLTTM